jgi:hypothetical protein
MRLLFCCRNKDGIRTPEFIFSGEKMNEAVPRARASDGERETRGRIPPSPLKNYTIITTHYLAGRGLQTSSVLMHLYLWWFSKTIARKCL